MTEKTRAPSHSEEGRASSSKSSYEVLVAQTLNLLRVPDHRKKEARRWTEDVARTFKRNCSEQCTAPRLAHIKSCLPKAAKQARECAAFLNRYWLYVCSVAARHDLLQDSQKTPDTAPETLKVLSFDANLLQTLLSEMAELLERVHERWPADSGGESDLFSMFSGSPKLVLAVQCWELFWEFRPGEATGTVDGEYHCFIELVYALAMGKEAGDDHANVEWYAKRTAKFCRELYTTNPHIQRLRRALPPGTSPVGIVGASMAFARFSNTSSRLYDEIMSVSRREE